MKRWSSDHGSDDGMVWSQLAYHFSEAGPGSAATKALDLCPARGRRMRRGCWPSRKRHACMRLALQLLDRHFPHDLVQRCDVMAALGDAELWCDVPETAVASYRQAAELARNAV